MSEGQPATATAPAGRLRNDVVVIYGGKLTTLVVTAVVAIVLARGLGASGRGTFAAASSFALLLVQCGTLGLVAANPYLVATGKASVGRLAAMSLWIAAAVGLALIGLGAAVSHWLPGVVGGVDWPSLLIALASVPAMLAVLFLQSLLLGEGRMVAYSGLEACQGLIMLVGLLAAFESFSLSVTAALGVVTIVAYLSVGALLVLLRSHRPLAFGPDVELGRMLLGHGVRLYAASLVGFLVLRLDVLLVNGYLGAHSAGIYAVVAGLAEGMYLLPAVIGLNVFTRVARDGGTDMTAEIFRSIGALFGVLCLISIPLAAPTIDIMFGPEFSEAVELYYWILPGIYCLGMTTILSSHFAGKGFPIAAIFAWIAGLLLNVVMNVLLLESQGLYIAALASSLSYALVLVLFMNLFRAEIGGWRQMVPRPSEVVRFTRRALNRGTLPS